MCAVILSNYAKNVKNNLIFQVLNTNWKLAVARKREMVLTAEHKIQGAYTRVYITLYIPKPTHLRPLISNPTPNPTHLRPLYMDPTPPPVSCVLQ